MSNTSEVTGLDPLLVSLDESRQKLGIGRTTHDRLVKEGELEVVKIGARTLVVVDSIRSYVERHRAGAA